MAGRTRSLAAGICPASTAPIPSLPLFVSDNVVFGGLAGVANAAIPLGDPGSLGAGVHSGVAGSGDVGTSGNPATGGSGLNMFEDPQAAFNAFRRIQLSRDNRPRANAFRGPGFWNLDFRLAKDTRITNRVRWELSADFFNVFNHVNLNNPSLSLNNPATFGVYTSQTGGARTVQIGSRISF